MMTGRHSELGTVRAEAIVLPSDPDQQVAATIGMMGKYAHADQSAAPVRQLAAFLREGLGHGPQSAIAYCERVWDITSRLVRFVLDEQIQDGLPGLAQRIRDQDGEVVEILIRPIDLLSADRPVGDCDDFSMLAASLILAGGIPCRFATVSGDGSGYWSHVYLVAYPNGVRIPIDASHGEFAGWETDRNFRLKEWTMLIPTGLPGETEGMTGMNGLGVNWDFIQDMIKSGLTTAGDIFKIKYSVPDAPPPGTTYRAPDGTIITSGTGPGILNPGSGEGISTSTLLIIGVLLFGFTMMNRR